MSSRRKWVRRLVGILITLLVAVAGAAAYFLVRPAPLPEAEVALARQAYVTARLTPGVQPEDLARADSLSVSLEGAFAEERTRWIRFRRPTDLIRSAEALAAAAALAESAAAGRRIDGLQTNRVRLDALTKRLNRMSNQVAVMPGAKRLRRAFQKGEFALGCARDLEAQGDLAALTVQLDSASAAIERAEILLDRRTARMHDPEFRRRWQAWVDETTAATGQGSRAIVVDKLRRRCVVLRGGRVEARYTAELGRNGLADKLYAGDGATPEGRYLVVHKNPDSRFNLALLLDYPDAKDLAEHRRAAREGRVPAGVGPGGFIEIHGHGGRGADWTDGCIALQDSDMEALFNLIDVGTPVTIVGTARLPGE